MTVDTIFLHAGSETCDPSRGAAYYALDGKDFTSSTTPDDIVAALRRRDIKATYRQTERGGRNIGEAINAATVDLKADLLVMGGFGHSRFRDFILGGATRSILAAPRVPSLISH